MPTKKTKSSKVESQIQWPKITVGNHSTFIEHEDGRVEHQIDWDKLSKEIDTALTNHKKSSNITTTKQTKKKNEA